MNQDSGLMTCTIGIESLAISGETIKKFVHRNATCILGRNEFRDIVLNVELGKKTLNYNLREIQLHTKFVKDGKATVKLPDKNVQLLFSNCPPDKLVKFLKTMKAKHTCLKHQGFVSERQKLLSDAPRVFQEISPLSLKDVQTIHNLRAKQAEESTLMTPKGKNLPAKRKRMDVDIKENEISKACKIPRNSLTVKSQISQQLTKEQRQVLNAVLSGTNIFFTGSAGTGKSYLLRRIIGSLPPNYTFVTASTGVAACHIGGTTLHSFAGIGSGTATLERCIELASRPQVAAQWRKCRHLIIDEISMVDGDFFTKLEVVARVIRKSDDHFGGMQLILCGDFLQLPPVVKGQEKKKFCFQSNAWRKCVQKTLELTEVHRQKDKDFVGILNNIRMGRCPEHVSRTLKNTSQHCIDKEGILATRLCTHKEDVDHINTQHLGKLPGEGHVYESTDSDEYATRTLNNMCPVPQRLELKKGAQVMLAKNLDIQKGLVNGARGIVIGFEPGDLCYPIVKFVCGAREVMRPERWIVKSGGNAFLTRRQVPLKLAWAISIHKSQGMTLDCVEISLSRVFECGQAYVALSRACNLLGLRVLDFDTSCVRAHPDVLKYYSAIAEKQKSSVTEFNIW